MQCHAVNNQPLRSAAQRTRDQDQRDPTHLDVPLLDVHEPRRLHGLALQLLVEHSESAAGLAAALLVDAAPLAQGGVLGDAAVVALPHGGHLVALEPAARRQVVVGLLEEAVPVVDAADQPAHVDVVEVGEGEGPGLRAVFDLAVSVVSFWVVDAECLNTVTGLQFDVGGDPDGLDGGDVGADDFSAGEFLSKITEKRSAARLLSDALRGGNGVRTWPRSLCACPS